MMACHSQIPLLHWLYSKLVQQKRLHVTLNGITSKESDRDWKSPRFSSRARCHELLIFHDNQATSPPSPPSSPSSRTEPICSSLILWRKKLSNIKPSSSLVEVASKVVVMAPVAIPTTPSPPTAPAGAAGRLFGNYKEQSAGAQAYDKQLEEEGDADHPKADVCARLPHRHPLG